LRVLGQKIKEVLFAVGPITVLVLILSFTLTPLETPLIIRFVIGAVLIMVGLTLFLLGVNIGITPIGNHMGSMITKRNKIWIVIIAGLALGFIISIAEPDLHILAGQVSAVTSGMVTKFAIVGVVSAGIAVMLAFGLVRIVYNIPLYLILTVMYGIILVLAVFTSREFLAISFDASGATTGALTVPFILALAIGVSTLKKDSKASEKDSFGLVAIASTGAIIALMLMSIFSKTQGLTGTLEQDTVVSNAVFMPFIQKFPHIALEIFIALSPILLVFVFFQAVHFKMPAKTFITTLIGMTLTFLGLVFFLVGVNAGFMDAAGLIGQKMALLDNKIYVVAFGFILGLLTILAEPAVHVLTNQIEDVTSGYVKKRLVMLTLSLGVGAAVALSMLRIVVPGIQLWHYLLPGYIISIAMTYFVPKLFVGIAFDSGGVASGPMTATFILAFSQGVAGATEGADVLADGFGMIAMVAMTPIIALQALGLLFLIKTKRGGAKKNGK
jgi:hypothetical protein